MNIELITVFSDQIAIKPLMQTVEKHNWPVTAIEVTWQGFGTKLLAVRDYLLNEVNGQSLDGFFFCDANDVLLLGNMEEAVSKLNMDSIVFNAEKNCWPDKDLEALYDTESGSEWKYLNSGAYFAPRGLFLSLFDYDMPEFSTDDQRWATSQLLFNKNSKIRLDTNCEVFQCYSFIAEDDFEYGETKVKNLKTGTTPIFFHGNGRTDMSKLEKYI